MCDVNAVVEQSLGAQNGDLTRDILHRKESVPCRRLVIVHRDPAPRERVRGTAVPATR